MTVVVLAAGLAVALVLFGVSVVIAADNAQRDADLQALILSQGLNERDAESQLIDEFDVESDRWRWGR